MRVPGGRMRRRFGASRLRLALTLAAVFALISSPGCELIRSITNPASQESELWRQEVTGIIEQTRDEVDGISSDWQSVARETVDKIDQVPHKIAEETRTTIRNEVNDTFARATATAGGEFRCDVDFLHTRVKEDLNRVITLVSGGKPAPRLAAVCVVVPSSIDMNIDPTRRTSVEFHGYNFDTDGVKSSLIASDGTTSDVTRFEARTSHYLLTLNLGGNGVPLSDTSKAIRLLQGDQEVSAVNIIQPQPVDLQIDRIDLQPSAPTRGSNVHVTVTVRNTGAGSAGQFQVSWDPGDGHTRLKTPVGGLGPNQPQAVGFDYVYQSDSRTRPFDSVAAVDVDGQVRESNEANNSMTRQVTVAQKRASVTVAFTSVNIHDDTDPFGSGEMWLDFRVNGQTGRWPTSGTADVSSGGTYGVNRTFNVIVPESDPLDVYVNGVDDDSPGSNDAMGSVSKPYHANDNFGAGDHSEGSYGGDCDGACYTIHYTVQTRWLP